MRELCKEKALLGNLQSHATDNCSDLYPQSCVSWLFALGRESSFKYACIYGSQFDKFNELLLSKCMLFFSAAFYTSIIGKLFLIIVVLQQ
jgi:hypothetical protein